MAAFRRLQNFFSLNRRILAALFFFSVSVVPGVAHAQVVTMDGMPGRFGTPYLSLGPVGNKVWENYRKTVQDQPLYSSVQAQGGAGAEVVKYTQVRHGCLPQPGCTFNDVGLLVGTVESLNSYDSAQFYLVGAQRTSTGATEAFDMRFGFLENNAAGGGSGFSQFLINHRGDAGEMDLFFNNFGVDGVYVGSNIVKGSSHWLVGTSRANLVAADSMLDETGRKSYFSSVSSQGFIGTEMTPDTNVYPETNVPISSPLTIRWYLSQLGGVTTLNVVFGESASISWIIDDGVSAFGLTNPNNPDGIGYQNQSLDLTHLLPILFIGKGYDAGDDLSPTEMDIGLRAFYPEITGLPLSSNSGTTNNFKVSFRDLAGLPPSHLSGTLHFVSDDLTASLPHDFPFTVPTLTGTPFQVSFESGGVKALRAIDANSGIQSPAAPVAIRYFYTLGCNSTGVDPVWPLVLGVLILGVYRRLRPILACWSQWVSWGRPK